MIATFAVYSTTSAFCCMLSVTCAGSDFQAVKGGIRPHVMHGMIWSGKPSFCVLPFSKMWLVCRACDSRTATSKSNANLRQFCFSKSKHNKSPPFEALPLLVDSLECKVSGFAPQLDGVQIPPLLGAHGLQHFELYGEAVAVPARHIARPLALK